MENNENFSSKFNKIAISNFTKLLKHLINYLENDLFLSKVLFSSAENDVNKVRDFKLKLREFKDEDKYDGIKNIYFGFNSGLYHSIELIDIKCKNLIEKENNENDLTSEIISDFKLQKLKDFLKEKYSILYKDYLLYFILVIIKIDIKNSETKQIIINLLDKILKKGYIMNYYEQKNGLNEDNIANIKNFSKTVIFLESNKELISCILSIYLDFLKIIKELEKFEPKEYRNEKYYLSEAVKSLIDIITTEGKFAYYSDTNNNKLYITLLKKNLNLFQIIGRKTNNSAYIQGIEIFIDLIKNDSTYLIEFILKNNSRIEDILLKSFSERINPGINLNHIIYLSISNALIIKFKSEKDKQNKLEILKNYITDKNLSRYCLSFWNIILKDGNYFSFDKANQNFLNNEDSDLEIKINENLNNNELLIEILLFYFEMYHENFYFEKINKKVFLSDKDKYLELLGNDSFELLTKGFEFYEDKYKKKIKSLKLLNIIGYIKAYLKLFSSILYKCENREEFFNFNSLDEKLHLSTISEDYMKNLKIYFSELIFILCNKKDNVLYDFIKNKEIKYLDFIGKNFNDSISELKNNAVDNYFKFIYEIPSLKLIKEKLTEKNKILKWVIDNKENIYKLKKLQNINSIANKIMNHINYKLSKNYTKQTLLKDEKAKIAFFNERLMKEYIESYNSLLSERGKKLNYSNYDNYSLDYFVVDKNNENNSLYEIYGKFIKYQNEFIKVIYDNCDEYKNEIQNILSNEIYVQNANERDIINFNEEKFLDIIINFTYPDFSQEDKIIFNKTDLNLDNIEKKILEDIIPGIKKFISGDYAIKIIHYEDEKYNDLNDDILHDFETKIKPKDVNEEQKKKIIESIKDIDKKEILLLLQSLMIFILRNNNKEKANIIDIIELMKNNDIENNNLKKFFDKFVESNIDNDDPYNQGDEEDNQKEEFQVCQLLSIFNIIRGLI